MRSLAMKNSNGSPTFDHRRKVLIVEDEKDLSEILVSLLGEFYPYIQTASNGREGLDLMKQESFALVLSDIKMPEMTGIEMFVAAKEAGVQSPFVFITAFSDEVNIMSALRLGAFDFIKKPFNDEEVINVVDRGLELGYRRSQLIANLEPNNSSTKNETNLNMIRYLELKNFKKRA